MFNIRDNSTTLIKPTFYRSYFLLFALCFSINLVLTPSTFALSKTIHFEEKELQTRINALLPITKKKSLISVTLTSAELDLLPTNNQLKLTTELTFKTLGINSPGVISAKGSLRYEKTEAAFYLDDVDILQIEFNNLKPKYQDIAKPLAAALLTQALKSQPIFKFSDETIKQQMAKAVLDDVKISENGVDVVLSVF